MANNGGVASLGRVKLTDLIPSEGLPSESYKVSVSTLSNSFAQFSAAIIQFPSTDTSLLRSCLDSSRLYFHQRPPPATDIIHSAPPDDSSSGGEWCKTSGYYVNPQLSLETYDYRPGLTPPHIDTSLVFPPSALPDIFALMAKTARHVLDAITFYLNLRSSAFAQVLDNLPLRNREVSSSVLSVCCHGRQSFQDDAQMVIYQTEHDHHVDKSLVTIVLSDKPGLHVRDFQGRWVLVDADLGPQDAVVYPGLALYQATAGYVNPALHRTEISNMVFGRFSLAFKLMPKSLSSLSCSEMRAAGHGVEAQFQLPVPVDDFMQRPHSTDQLFNRQAFQSIGYPTPQDGKLMSKMW